MTDTLATVYRSSQTWLKSIMCGLMVCGLVTINGTIGAAQTFKLKVAALPIIPCAPLFVAIERGFFKEEGLTIETSTGGSGGAAIIASVVSGDADVGFTDIVAQFLALDRGMKLKIVARAGGDGGTKDNTISALYVKEDSAIREPKDLAGKVIAVNALNAVTDLTAKGALKKYGVDPNGVKFVEAPFPQLGPAAAAGRVDAAVLVEPFITAQAEQLKLRPVLYNYVEVIPSGPISVYFATADYTANQEALARFDRVMTRAAEFSAANPTVARETLTKFTQIPSAVAAKVALGGFTQRGNEAIDNLANLAREFGLIKRTTDLSELRDPRGR